MMRAILMASAFSMQIWKKQEGFCVKKTWKQRMRLGAAAWMLAMLAAGCGGNDKLVSDPQAIAPRGRRSRQFVERHYDCRLVAQRFLDFWTSKL